MIEPLSHEALMWCLVAPTEYGTKEYEVLLCGGHVLTAWGRTGDERQYKVHDGLDDGGAIALANRITETREKHGYSLSEGVTPTYILHKEREVLVEMARAKSRGRSPYCDRLLVRARARRTSTQRETA